MAGAALCVTMFVPKVTGRKVKGEVTKNWIYVISSTSVILYRSLSTSRIRRPEWYCDHILISTNV